MSADVCLLPADVVQAQAKGSPLTKGRVFPDGWYVCRTIDGQILWHYEDCIDGPYTLDNAVSYIRSGAWL